VAKFYLTTAIDYSNGDPHLGHALEKVGADAIARYRRLRGDAVHYVMGMDEHGLKVLQTAEQEKIAPQQLADRLSERFNGVWHRLLCSHDDWIRTTEPRHERAVTTLLTRIQERNPDDLFLGEYEGLYCVGCEEFKAPNQIVDGKCIEHPGLTLVPTREKNHFFRLSRYTRTIDQLIRSGSFTVEPDIRRNEILRLLEEGLQDLSISRIRLPWGIPMPGAPDYTVYVWFDALINYLSATGFPEPGYDQLWPADLHVIGKGITRFHCVIWPAMLLAAGVELPRAVWAHGYVQWGGAKVSKSAGTAVNLDDAIDRHGPDALRYFLLREVGFTNDGDFTWERFDERYTADLADGLGNLAARSLAMIVKFREGKVPEPGEPTPLDTAGDAVVAAYQEAMDQYKLKEGAEAAWSLVTTANQFIVQHAPWALAKAGETRKLDAVLGALARCLERLAILSQPFIPSKAQQLWSSLGAQTRLDQIPWSRVQHPAPGGQVLSKSENLFPKPAAPQPTS
jgi:methionyl-tRNA synthetase